jgi:hypothetical protein
MTDFAGRPVIRRVDDSSPTNPARHEARPVNSQTTKCDPLCQEVIDLQHWRSEHMEDHQALEAVVRGTHARIGDPREPLPYTISGQIAMLVAHQTAYEKKLSDPPGRPQMISITEDEMGEITQMQLAKGPEVLIKRMRKAESSLTSATIQRIVMGVGLGLLGIFELGQKMGWWKW